MNQKDTLRNKKSWNKLYSNRSTKELQKEYMTYKKSYLNDTLRQFCKYYQPKKGDVYLEIGCGPCLFGLELAKRYSVKVVGVDFSSEAIESARKLFRIHGIKGAKFILGDIRDLPIEDNTIDIIYGGGVIEHVQETKAVINELYRVLKEGGVAFNTVPWLNIGALTYRQVWGNIPNLPILKQVAEFVHITILRGKHMRFGYEFSFLPSTLVSIHNKVGFREVTYDRFTVRLILEYIKPKLLRENLVRIINSTSLLWPMFYIVAKK